MTTPEIEELETKLASFRRTRAHAPESMHQWCDVLIADTGIELRKLLADLSPDTQAMIAKHDAESSSASSSARSTYPLSPTAPLQRLKETSIQ